MSVLLQFGYQQSNKPSHLALVPLQKQHSRTDRCEFWSPVTYPRSRAERRSEIGPRAEYEADNGRSIDIRLHNFGLEISTHCTRPNQAGSLQDAGRPTSSDRDPANPSNTILQTIALAQQYSQLLDSLARLKHTAE
jgi:hypothetical protein